MDNTARATQQPDAGSAQPPLPEALRAALARVRGPKGRKAFAQDFAKLVSEADLKKRKQLEWMLFGALRYAWQLGQLTYEDFDLLTDFLGWSPAEGELEP